MKRKIREYYEASVRLNQTINSDLKAVLLKHERVESFVENMAEQIDLADKMLRKKGKVLKLKTIEDTVNDMTNYFIMSVEIESHKRYESIMSKIQKEEELKRKQDLENTYNGNPTGEFEDIIMKADNNEV